MKKIFIVFSLIFILGPFVASAAVFSGGQTYNLGPSQKVNENLYVAGGNINISGQPQADVMAAGGTILINGNVGQDLTAAGGNISALGAIGQDARIVGGTIIINKNVGGDLMVLGGQITVEQGATVSGETALFGGQILINGNLNKNLYIWGGDVQINGKIAQNVKIKVSKSLTISSGAQINGNLEYWAPKQAIIESGAKISGKTTFNLYQPRTIKTNFLGVAGFAWLLSLLISLASALAIYFIFKEQIKNLLMYVGANFWKETLRGFVLAVVIPVAIIIFLVTVIGVILGILGALVYILFALISYILTPILLGTIIFRLVLKQPKFSASWLSVVVGVFVLRIVGFVPILGWLFALVFFLATFGSLFFSLWKQLEAERFNK